MKLKYSIAVFLLLLTFRLYAEIHIDFETIVGVRMGPEDAVVEGAAHFRNDRSFIIEIEFPDSILIESGTYSYNPGNGELIMNYTGSKGLVRYNVVSINGSVKFLMVNRVAEAPPFILELIYGAE